MASRDWKGLRVNTANSLILGPNVRLHVNACKEELVGLNLRGEYSADVKVM
jgi:hypothetical protein